MSRNKDVRELIRLIQSDGGEVSMTPGGHWKVYNPVTKRSVRIPASPGDVRSLKNARSRIRKIGLLAGTAR